MLLNSTLSWHNDDCVCVIQLAELFDIGTNRRDARSLFYDRIDFLSLFFGDGNMSGLEKNPPNQSRLKMTKGEQ